MTPEIFAEWLRRQGHQVLRTESSYWYDQGPRVYQAFPYHWTIEPGDEEIRQFLRDERIIGLRYSAPLTAFRGQISYHAVFEEDTYSLENLSKWSRKNVRRGLKNCEIEPISFERLAVEGFALQVDTLDRQGRRLDLKGELWRRRCLAAGSLDGFEAWGAIVNGQLGASVITFQMDDCCYMLYQQCHRDFLQAHVNNALSFEVTRTMVERPGIKSILYGLHSLDAPESVDEFKFRMGYAAKPVRQRVEFHPKIAPFMNKTIHTSLRTMLRLFPGHAALSKAEGLVRFYQYGKLPLKEQEIPAPLSGMDLSTLSE